LALCRSLAKKQRGVDLIFLIDPAPKLDSPLAGAGLVPGNVARSVLLRPEKAPGYGVFEPSRVDREIQVLGTDHWNIVGSSSVAELVRYAYSVLPKDGLGSALPIGIGNSGFPRDLTGLPSDLHDRIKDAIRIIR